MDSLLQDCVGVVVYFDDILVTGRDDKACYCNLERALERLHSAELKKCTFIADRGEHMGYVISASCLRPAPGKVQVLVEAPEPTDIMELQS